MSAALWISFAVAAVAWAADVYFTNRLVRHGLRDRNPIVKRITMPVYLILNALLFVLVFFSVRAASGPPAVALLSLNITLALWRGWAAQHGRSILRLHRL